MKRITISFAGSDRVQDGRVLRFDESIDFQALIQKIVCRLKASSSSKANDDRWELWLNNKAVLEDTNEIDDGDHVQLIRATKSDSKSNTILETTNGTATINTPAQDSDVEDVTEEVKEARRVQSIKLEENADYLSSDEEEDSSDEGSEAWDDNFDESSEQDPADEDDDDDYIDDSEEEEDIKQSSHKKRKAKPPPKPPLQAMMEEKDLPAAPGRPSEQEEVANDNESMEEVSTLAGGDADKKVRARIIKLLNTGFHDQSNENEAKNAMKLAQRMMRKHNLSQAILLKERLEKNDREQNAGSAAADEILKGGMVKVRIVNRKTGKPAVYARWLDNLTWPVVRNFDVKSYKEVRAGRRCNVVFYGIYTNCQLAAYAFRVATERISQMAAAYKPSEDQPSWRKITTKSARLSYSIGVATGIGDDVDRNLRMEKERRERKLEKARLAVSRGEACQESDIDDEDDDDEKSIASDPGENEGTGFLLASDNDDDNNDDTSDEVDGAQVRKSKSEKESIRRLSVIEKEAQAAIVLVDHREKIAERVLEEKGIKISKSQKRKPITFDNSSYSRGIKDAKEIDINQRAIRDEVKVKRESKKRK